MKKSLLLSILFFSKLLFICGCSAKTKLADYQPKSEEESEALNFIKECDIAYQNDKYANWLACFHDNATIRIYEPGNMFGGSIVSKQQYKGYLEGGISMRMPLDYDDPKITTTGEKATLKSQTLDGNVLANT